METLTLTAPDISCEHCKATIEREVGALEGVEAVVVDVDRKDVRVAFDPTVVSRERIVETLDDEGYPVTG